MAKAIGTRTSHAKNITVNTANVTSPNVAKVSGTGDEMSRSQPLRPLVRQNCRLGPASFMLPAWQAQSSCPPAWRAICTPSARRTKP